MEHAAGLYNKRAYGDVVAWLVQVDGVKVEVALQWCSDAFSDIMLGFVNSIKTVDGGTHMDGFKAALTRTVNSLGRKSKVLKEGDANLSGDHIREGLGAIVSVKVSALHHTAPHSVGVAVCLRVDAGHCTGYEDPSLFIRPVWLRACNCLYSTCMPWKYPCMSCFILILYGQLAYCQIHSTLDCVLGHLQVPDPEFEGQTKTRLGNPEVRKIVEGIVSQVCHCSQTRRPLSTTMSKLLACRTSAI